jgi:hypothetical protein
VAVLFFGKNNAVRVDRRTDACSLGGEFVLCQGESGSGASLGACNRDERFGLR